MADLLPIATGTVDCRLVVATNDSTDPDVSFDTVAPQGFVYLTPRRNAFPAQGEPAIVVPDLISLAVNADGWATMPTELGEPTAQAVIDLPVAEGMTWQVSFDLWLPAYPWQFDTKKNRLRLDPFDVPVTAGQHTHIADYLPLGVDPSKGTVWVKGDRGAGISGAVEVDGALILETEDGDLLDPVPLPPSSVPGPASDLSIGAVTAGTSESDFDASITGAAPDFKLNLKLPRGLKGNNGAGIPAGGTTGQVPARTSDGGSSWANVKDLIPEATTTASGLLSAADKTALNAAASKSYVDAQDAANLAAAKAYADAYHPPHQKNLPAGITDRPGTFDPATSVYTPDSFRGASARGALEGSKAGAALASVIKAGAAVDRVTTSQIVYLGDSEVVGTGATVGTQDAAAQAMSQLRAAGYAMSDGVIMCHDNNKDDGITNRDSRLAMTGTWTAAGIKSDPTKLDYQFHVTSKVSGSTLTFSFAQACVQIDLYIFGNSAAFTYQVDAGTAVTHTPNGQQGLEIVKIGNLSNAAHTLKVTTTGTANVYVLGARGLTSYSCEISKIGFWGALTPAALPRTWWSSPELLKATQPQAIVLQFGTNEALKSSYTVDQYKGLMLAAITALRSTVPGAAIYLVSSFQPNVTDTVWTTWRNAQYDIADIAGIRLGDCVAKVGNRTTATAAGLYSDATHPNAAGYAKQGELLRQMLVL
jgi:hypothetical protein